MPPTIQTNNADRSRKRPGDRRSDLVCRVKYCNTLPDIPFDPKFITYPFDSNRFVQYNSTSLERNYKHDLLTENDLGIVIDLITPDAYAVDPNVTLDPADEKLLEDEILTPQNSKRSRHHATSVSWMRRTEYISTEYNRFQQSFDKMETKVGVNVKKVLKEETIYQDRDSQISAINKTFDEAKAPIEKHYSKPGVTAVKVLPVLPDFDLWKYPCAQVIFDSDPAPLNRPLNSQIEEMSQAMIRGVMDESGEQFVAYFLPTEDTVKKRKRDKDAGNEYEFDEEYDYKMAREYNWNVKNKASKGYEENYFFVLRDNDCYYNELETRVRLSKRRNKGGKSQSNSRLVVKHRPLNAVEMKTQELRLRQLEPAMDEEEEEEEEEVVAAVEDTQEEEEKEEEKKAENDESEKSGSENEKEKDEESEAEEKSGGEESDAEENKSDNEDQESSAKSSSGSSSSSDSESEDEQKRNAEQIFGSDSD